MEANLTYDAAYKELNLIASEIESGNMSVDVLAEKGIKGLIILFIGIFLPISTLLAQDRKTFYGEIDTKFHLSATHKLSKNQRAESESAMEPYLDRKLTLTEYFRMKNSGKEEAAQKIIMKDSFLKEKDEFTFSYMFMLIKMQELNILYSPLFQIDDDSATGIVISCSPEQIEKLNNKEGKIAIKCIYIGELIIDGTKAYKLDSIKE